MDNPDPSLIIKEGATTSKSDLSALDKFRSTQHDIIVKIWSKLLGNQKNQLDYDVDAVSLATFDIDNNGQIALWSPYANLDNIENLEASMKLPFPSGEEFQILVNPQDTESSTEFIEKYASLFKITLVYAFGLGESKWEFHPTGDILVEIVANTPESIALLGEMLQEKELNIYQKQLPALAQTKLKVAGAMDFALTPEQSLLFWQALANAINDHNLYLGQVSDYNMSKIVNNYIMNSMYEIGKNPVNLIEAQTSVDGTTGPLKEATKKNKEETILASKRTPGNFVNKAESINENQVGKEGIAVCATGLKTFFALSQYNNMLLNAEYKSSQDRSAKQARLFLGSEGKGIKIMDKEYKLLANINPKNVKNVRLDILEELVNNGVEYDLALTLSALLSLATDNAKELALSKLNAGTKTIGMYIYGISIGMDFNELSDIMMSRTAKMLASKLESNVFMDSLGFTNVDLYLFDYYDKSAYRLKSLAKTVLPDGTPITDAYSILEEQLRNTIIKNYDKKNLGEALAAYAKDFKVPLKDKLKTLEALKLSQNYSQINNDIKRNLAQEYFNAFIDTVKLYIYESHTIFNSHQGRQIFNALKTLAGGAAEMKRLGRILSLNQGIKTKADELITLINHFERAIYDITGDEKDIIDIVSFVKNPRKRAEAINKYEAVKHSFNIYDVVSTIPHFAGYLKALATAKQENMESYTFRNALRNSHVIHKIVGGRELDVIKGYYNYLDDMNISNYLKKTKIAIPKGNIVVAPDGTTHTLQHDVTVNLGTEWGRDAFRRWFETEVIPNIKKGIISDGEVAEIVKSNSFIKDLTFDLRTNTVSHNPELVSTLPINMLPRIDSERAVFNKYKAEFNKIAGVLYKWDTRKMSKSRVLVQHNEMPLLDLFAIYTMIAHNWKLSENSLVPIFEDMNNLDFLKGYHDYISNLDLSSRIDSLPRELTSLDKDMLLYVTPVGSPWSARSKYTIARNKISRKFELMMKEKPLSPQERENMSEEEIEAITRKRTNNFSSINSVGNLNMFHSGTIDAPTTEITFNLNTPTSEQIHIKFLEGTNEILELDINDTKYQGIEVVLGDGSKKVITQMLTQKLDGQEIPNIEHTLILIKNMLYPC